MARKVDDNFYRKGQFVVSFLVSIPTKKGVNKDTVNRTIGVFLSDLRESTRLKISSYFDIEPYTINSDKLDNDELLKKVKEVSPDYKIQYKVYFVVYNKLGLTNLRSLRKYFDERTQGNHVRVIDPQTSIRLLYTKFTITYYFIDFVYAPYGKYTWDVLHDLLQERDRGFSKLKQIKRSAMMRRRQALTNPSIVLLTNATKRLVSTKDKDEAILAINDIIDAANDILDDLTSAKAASFDIDDLEPVRRRRSTSSRMRRAAIRRKLRRLRECDDC